MLLHELQTPADWLGVLVQLEDRAVDLYQREIHGGYSKFTQNQLERLCELLNQTVELLKESHECKQRLFYVPKAKRC